MRKARMKTRRADTLIIGPLSGRKNAGAFPAPGLIRTGVPAS
jgi:hypothetical protein